MQFIFDVIETYMIEGNFNLFQNGKTYFKIKEFEDAVSISPPPPPRIDTADDNFKFDENGRNFSKRVENSVGKGKIARCERFLLFQQCFLKTSAADT